MVQVFKQKRIADVIQITANNFHKCIEFVGEHYATEEHGCFMIIGRVKACIGDWIVRYHGSDEIEIVINEKFVDLFEKYTERF